MESGEDVAAALVADDDAAETGKPCQGTLDLPAVAAEALAGLDAAAGDARDDGPLAQGPAAAWIIVALVGVQFGRSASRPAGALPDGRDGVDGGFELLAVMDVGRRNGHGQRDAVGVDDDMALGPWLAAVRRVRAGVRTPLFAGTLALSSAARLQSMALT